MRREYVIVGSDQVSESGTIYFNEAGPSGTRPVDWSKYSTFISHKSTDIRPAQEAAIVLANSGLVGSLSHKPGSVSAIVNKSHIVAITDSYLCVLRQLSSSL